MRPHVILIVAALLLSGGCSDDGANTNADTGVPDTGPDVSMTDQGPEPDVLEQDLPAPDLPEPDAPLNPSAWTEVTTSIPSSLNDVWGLDANKVYAVGKNGAIMRYGGSGWSVMASPAKISLWGISGNDQEMVAVGDEMDFRWDGTSWIKGYESTSSYTSYFFRAITLPPGGSEFFAVGDLDDYVRHRQVNDTGDYWDSVSLSGLNEKTVNDIWASSPTEMFMVGEGGLIYHCSGSCTSSSGWSSMSSGVTTDLKGVYGFASDDVYAVGINGLILHYDGSTWNEVTLNSATYFQDVWGSSPTDIYVVGHPIFEQDESIFHFDGTAWTKMPPPNTSFLNAIWGSSATDVWAVGNYNILHYDGSAAP